MIIKSLINIKLSLRNDKESRSFILNEVKNVNLNKIYEKKLNFYL